MHIWSILLFVSGAALCFIPTGAVIGIPTLFVGGLLATIESKSTKPKHDKDGNELFVIDEETGDTIINNAADSGAVEESKNNALVGVVSFALVAILFFCFLAIALGTV